MACWAHSTTECTSAFPWDSYHTSFCKSVFYPSTSLKRLLTGHVYRCQALT